MGKVKEWSLISEKMYKRILGNISNYYIGNLVQKYSIFIGTEVQKLVFFQCQGWLKKGCKVLSRRHRGMEPLSPLLSVSSVHLFQHLYLMCSLDLSHLLQPISPARCYLSLIHLPQLWFSLCHFGPGFPDLSAWLLPEHS